MRSHVKGAVLVAAFVVAAGCGGGDDKKPAGGGGGDSKAPAAAPAGGGSGKAYDAAKATASVKFTVKWTGAAPASMPIMISGDEFCKSAHTTPVMNEQFVVNGDGTLPNAFVWAKDGPHKGMTGLPESASVTLDQKGCMYSPHVFGVRVGQKFKIHNSDGTKHNVHSHPGINEPFNQAQDKDGVNEFSFSKPEAAIPIQCDVHSWMKSYAFVADHPFFGTTDGTGAVTIGKLPAGDYTFRIWHEQFSGDKAMSQDVKVTLKDGESATQVVEFK